MKSGRVWQILFLIVCSMFLRVSLDALSPLLVAAEEPIASKHTRELDVVLVNNSGVLTAGDNHICVLFTAAGTDRPANVQDVRMKFTFHIGRNSGEPITAQLSRVEAGRYCGSVDLGRQYYDPANYYVEMRFTDALGKTRKISFWVSVKGHR